MKLSIPNPELLLQVFCLTQRHFSLPFLGGNKAFPPAPSLPSHVGAEGQWDPWMLSHSRGSVDSTGLRHICWESLNAHLQSSKVKADFISLGSSLQGQVPHQHVGKSIRALKPRMFWFSVKILILPSPVRIRQSPN